MDLKERLKDSINQLELPVKCLLGYLDGKRSPDLRLQMLPGSTVVEQDYAGNRTEEYVMEIIMRGTDEAVISQVLGMIANLLADHNFHLISSDESFEFIDLEVASFPHPIMADVSGEVTYVFDFKVTVETYWKG